MELSLKKSHKTICSFIRFYSYSVIMSLWDQFLFWSLLRALIVKFMCHNYQQHQRGFVVIHLCLHECNLTCTKTRFCFLYFRKSQWDGDMNPMGCILMMMQTVMRQVHVQSAPMALETEVFHTTCGRLRMWLRFWTTVLVPTGLRGKRG